MHMIKQERETASMEVDCEREGGFHALNLSTSFLSSSSVRLGGMWKRGQHSRARKRRDEGEE